MHNEANAIAGTRRQTRELADGTLRVMVDIDPRFKADFNRLFPNIDAPVALAPLAKDFERREPEQKAGAICKWLGARCKESDFWRFLHSEFGEWSTPIESEDAAVALVRYVCGVQSRRDIDGNADARARFESEIRGPYAEFLKGGKDYVA